jgi:flagellar biosynthesis protein
LAEEKENKDEKKPALTKRLAVAIRYDVEKDKAPLIIATGRGTVADEILRVAEENKIPLYEDKKLVEMLSRVELETEVPPELYVLVAQVLFFVYKLDKMAQKREKLLQRVKEQKPAKK